MRSLLAALLLFLVTSSTQATVWRSPSCSQTDVQNTISAGTTVNGDTVQVLGPCTLQFSSFVTVNKAIFLQGVSNPVITSTSEGFILNASASGTTRISGFTCNRAGNVPTDFNGHCLQINTAPGNSTYRIDHWAMCAGGGNCNTANTIFITISGVGPGLFDHNTMSGNGSSFIQENGTGSNQTNTTGWTANVVPGGPNMLFFEDNVISNSACTGVTGCAETSNGWIQGVGGTQTVIRHNTFNMISIDQHGSQNGGNECTGGGSACTGNVGVRWYEIYNNNFVVGPGGSWFSYMDLRAGSGVIFNNTVTGSNGSFGFIRIYEENTLPWPQAYQPGSGLNDITSPHASCVSGTQNTTPIYIWTGTGSLINTGATNPTAFNIKLDNGVSSTFGNVQLNRDLFVSSTQPATLRKIEISGDTCSTTYSYIPFTYPHPLISPTPAVSLSRSSIAFGNQNVSTSSANVNTIVTNTGNGNLTVSSVAVTGTDLTQYSINTNTCTVTILPGGTCSFNTVFSPTSTGVKNAFATVTSNAPTSPNNVTLSGTGVNPITVTVTVQPSPLSFGNQIIGQVSTPVTVTVSSTGTGNEVLGTPFANFTAGGVNPVPGDFALVGSGGSPCSNALSLAPGTNCTFTTTLTATQAALETATLNVNGTISATIQASGTGVPASPIPAGAPQIFSTIFGPGTIDLVIGNCPKTCKVHLVCANCTTSYSGTIQ